MAQTAEVRRATKRAWYYKNRDSVLARRKELPKIVRQYKPLPKEQRLRNYLKSAYGLTWEDYIKLLEDQDYGCAICKIAEADTPHKRLHVDHDHETKVVRGLLCHNCNVGVGHFRENPELLDKAIAYLEDHDG